MAETIEGGRYRVGGKLVNADGEPLKGKAAEVEAEDNGADESGGDALSGVDFASDAAREAAQEASLSAADFKGATPSSANGFTKPDVTALVEARG